MAGDATMLLQAAGAAADEDEEVARLGRALFAIVPDGSAGLDLMPDKAGDAGSKARLGAALILHGLRRIPRMGGFGVGLWLQRPEVDRACMAAPERGVAHQVGVVGRVQREG